MESSLLEQDMHMMGALWACGTYQWNFSTWIIQITVDTVTIGLLPICHTIALGQI